MSVKVQAVKDLLELENDKLIAILRHFDWDQNKIDEFWWTNDSLPVEIGIAYNQSLEQQHPQITSSFAANNGGMCPVMYDEFDEADPDMKAVSLCCGHQFSAIAWKEYL